MARLATKLPSEHADKRALSFPSKEVAVGPKRPNRQKSLSDCAGLQQAAAPEWAQWDSSYCARIYPTALIALHHLTHERSESPVGDGDRPYRVIVTFEREPEREK